MGRFLRATDAGFVNRCLNRVNGRLLLFDVDAEYEAIKRVLFTACEPVP